MGSKWSSPEALGRFKGLFDTALLHTTRRSVGCDRCKQTGYRGRTVVAETMPHDEGICKMVVRGASTDELRSALREHGYSSLQQDALGHVANGLTSLDEALRVAFV